MGLIHGTVQLSNPTRPEPQEWRCVFYMDLVLRPQHPGEYGRSPPQAGAKEPLGNEPSKRVQACDLLGMNNSWGI